MFEGRTEKSGESVMGWPKAVPADFSWKGLTVRCAAANCPVRFNMQPAWLAKYRGVQFQQRWYHSAECLEGALVQALLPLLVPSRNPAVRAHRLPIGLLLVKRGAITPEELREAVRLQNEAGAGKLGYWLRQLTNLTEDQICMALSQQWGCPVFPLERHVISTSVGQSVPFPILAAAKAVPAFASLGGRQWHVAFSDHVDHTLLYAIEEVLDCRTLPCVSRESAVKESLELLRKNSAGKETCFDTLRDPDEMASTICNYAAQMEIRKLKLVRAAGYVWAALHRQDGRRDLLFRLGAETVIPLPDGTGTPKAKVRPVDIRRDAVCGPSRVL